MNNNKSTDNLKELESMLTKIAEDISAKLEEKEEIQDKLQEIADNSKFHAIISVDKEDHLIYEQKMADDVLAKAMVDLMLKDTRYAALVSAVAVAYLMKNKTKLKHVLNSIKEMTEKEMEKEKSDN